MPVVLAPTEGQAQGQGTPSSLSPTPSPSGSVGSVGSNSSQSSGYSSGNGNANANAGGNGQSSGSSAGPSTAVNPPCVSVPINIFSMVSKQHKIWANLKSSHDLWERADKLIYRGNHTGM